MFAQGVPGSAWVVPAVSALPDWAVPAVADWGVPAPVVPAVSALPAVSYANGVGLVVPDWVVLA